MSNCGQYDFDTPWPCMLLEWGKGKKPRNDERKRSELCNVGYTRTNWFSQPGFLGVESSSWTMSPAMAEGASRRSKITAQNKRIEQIFSEAMDAVSRQWDLCNHYQLTVETERDRRCRVLEQLTFDFDPFNKIKKKLKHITISITMTIIIMIILVEPLSLFLKVKQK